MTVGVNSNVFAPLNHERKAPFIDRVLENMEKNKVLFSFIRMGISIIVILLVVYFGIQIAAFGYDFGYRVFTETAVDDAPGTDALIQIKEDMSEYEIAQLLEERGMVRDAKLFFLQLKLSNYSGKEVPGVYTVNSSMTPQEIMAVISPEQETESTETTESASPVVSTEETENAEEEYSADDDFESADDDLESAEEDGE
jgi:UPF0755 protein